MVLKVSTVYFYPEENAKKHNTKSFEMVHMNPNIPIVRRGQAFFINIRFDGQEYNQDNDKIKIIFSLGLNPHPLKNTQGVFHPITNNSVELSNKDWCGKIISTNNGNMMMEVMSPNDAPFGSYKLKIECENGSSSSTYIHDSDLWILYNPWVKEDLVHMPQKSSLDEYILTDVGKIWIGPYNNSKGREWVFGQFSACVLPAISLMLDKAKFPHQNRGDPIKMCRIISKIVNSNDDNGVLEGKWDGQYEDGTAPSSWTGSIDILEKFLETGNSVKYGQCWVFAGVVTTVCRTIGIPCRPVSNLVSAHDTNNSLTIDKYYDKDNNEIESGLDTDENNDSIWNYHVWNDVYMARQDLPKGYGGWQSIDSTPQETSDGFYQCGPASLEAIKNGEIGFNYDVSFMISSVNADFVKWKEDSTCEIGFRRISCNINKVGRMILTKRAFVFDPNGDRDREDITLLYKAREGSKEERLSLLNAVRHSRSAKKFFEIPENLNEDVTFKLNDLTTVNIGEGFTSMIQIFNTSNEVRTVDISLSAGSVYYTGNKAHTVKDFGGKIELGPRSRQNISMQVGPQDYLLKLVEYNNMKIFAICTVRETKQTWAGEDDFQILTPNIKIEVLPELMSEETQKLTLSFVNPLNDYITGGYFSISCPRVLSRTLKLGVLQIKPKGLVYATAQFPVRVPGHFTVIATFTSKQLLDVTGSATFDVL